MVNLFTKPKVLILDIETAPIEAHVWRLFDQNVGLNQIIHDSSILAWSAKWLDSKKIFYQDTGKQRNKRDDSKILVKLWDLLDTADVVVGQNSKQFDIKKINARFIINNINKGHPPSDYRQQDTKVMAKKVFGFTSNRLEYLAKTLNLQTKKMTVREFDGHTLWTECLNGNKRAWAEMKKYNCADLIATEELYKKLLAWSNTINHNVYHKMHDNCCACGSTEFKKWGFRYSNTGKFQRYKCASCGMDHVEKYNEISLKKRQKMFK
jgi:hypothetical protein